MPLELRTTPCLFNNSKAQPQSKNMNTKIENLQKSNKLQAITFRLQTTLQDAHIPGKVHFCYKLQEQILGEQPLGPCFLSAKLCLPDLLSLSQFADYHLCISYILL